MLWPVPILSTAHQQRPHPRREEGICVSLGRVFARTEALQGPVHAGGPHAQTHRGEAAQVHGKPHMSV